MKPLVKSGSRRYERDDRARGGEKKTMGGQRNNFIITLAPTPADPAAVTRPAVPPPMTTRLYLACHF
eukprot:511048-Amorphochlora_amoeboformis.AAC.2